MKRCALYVRVSTQEQKRHGLSVDSQIEALQAYCEQNGLQAYKIYNDAGFSARKHYKRRPALLEMIEDCKAGNIDLILMTKLDRFFRSVKDYYEVMSQIGEIPWRAIWEDYETETSSGVFKVNIMLSVAQSEADRTSERIKAVNDFKRARGDYLGKAPTGYVIQNGQLVKDPEKAEGMEAILKTYVKTGQLVEAMKKGLEYGVTFDRLSLLKTIRNPAYCGEASGGYSCEPYITKEEHEILMARLNQHTRKPKPDDRFYMFSGLIICPYCGYKMAGHAARRTHADGSEKIYLKYECARKQTTKMAHPHIQIVESNIEQAILDQIDQCWKREAEAVSFFNKKSGSADAYKQKKSLEQRLSRLAMLYEEGDIDVDSYRLKRDKIKDQISQIRLEPISQPKPLPLEWREAYDLLDAKHKQNFWRKNIREIHFQKGDLSHLEIKFLWSVK